MAREKFSEELRKTICAELTPTKRPMIKPFIKRVFGYDADRITNYSSLEGLLIWLLEDATKTQRQDFLDELDINTIRVCDECGKFMTEGYVVFDYIHLCSDKCLHKRYSPAQYDALAEMDDAYWTEWTYGCLIPNWATI